MSLTTNELAKFSAFCKDNNFQIPVESSEIFLTYKIQKDLNSL